MGELVSETFDYDGGRQVTAYVPSETPEAIVFAGDGQLIAAWGELLDGAADVPTTLVVGVHRLEDEMARLGEYSPVFDAERFAAHERFFVDDIGEWVRSELGVSLAADRTAVFGVSASGELALAIGLRHPDIYGAIFCASPGAGYQPPGDMSGSLPRTYLVAGTLEPFFAENATRWADALRGAGGGCRDDRTDRRPRRSVLAGGAPLDGGVGLRPLCLTDPGGGGSDSPR